MAERAFTKFKGKLQCEEVEGENYTTTESWGCIILVKEDRTATCWWKMAKISELIKSKDDVIRTEQHRLK